MYKVYKRILEAEESYLPFDRNLIDEYEKAVKDSKDPFVEELRDYAKGELTLRDLKELSEDPGFGLENLSLIEEFFDTEVSKINEHLYQIGDIWFYYHTDNNVFDYLGSSDSDDLKDYVDSADESELLDLIELDVEDIWIPGWETTIRQLKKSPGIVYHYTNEDALEQIKEEGELVGSSGTGLRNRNSRGIFTSVDPEEYASGTYGNIRLDINLDAYMKGEGKSYVEVEPEPDVMEAEIRKAVAHFFDIEDYHTEEENSGYTVIVGETIPLKYIEIWEE